uniref:Acetylornithine aminotransferase n=1 Tax=Rhizophora mucronata TaxID=61149 RepID=A0A2P2MTJ6_RHIMU
MEAMEALLLVDLLFAMLPLLF